MPNVIACDLRHHEHPLVLFLGAALWHTSLVQRTRRYEEQSGLGSQKMSPLLSTLAFVTSWNRCFRHPGSLLSAWRIHHLQHRICWHGKSSCQLLIQGKSIEALPLGSCTYRFPFLPYQRGN
jgi:hypothetical protein